MKELMYYTEYSSILGEIILAGTEDGLGHLYIETERGAFTVPNTWIRKDDFFSDVIRQLDEYFTGYRKVFSVKLAPEETGFQRRVRHELEKIPFGEVRTYGEIAAALGNPRASRAVGAACGRNPLPVIVPCHRVVGTGGKLTGYAFGIEIKERLLKLEAEIP